MFRWFDWVWRIVVAVIGIMVIWKFWMWWRPDPPTTYLRTDLINAQQADTFHTGFATVAVVRFDTGNNELQHFGILRNPDRHDDIEGYCYRLYEVSIGYPSLSAAIETSESRSGQPAAESEPETGIAEPSVLTGNVIEARHGGSATQYQCDQLNEVSADRPNGERLEALRKILIDNGQWDSHVSHARNVLTAFSATLTERRQAVAESRLENLKERRAALDRVASSPDFERWKTRTREALSAERRPDGPQPRGGLSPAPTGIKDLDEILTASPADGIQERGVAGLDAVKTRVRGIFVREIASAEIRLSNASGYLGSLKLTFSTVGIFGQTGGRWFWKRDEFYIRQDLAEAVYGTDFALDVSRKTLGLFGPKRLEIVVPEPQLLALDRYTTVLVARPPDFKRSGDQDGTEIESALSDDLSAQLTRVQPTAIRFARAAITAQIHALVESDVGEVRVKFSGKADAAPSQLTDIVRLMQSRDSPLDQ